MSQRKGGESNVGNGSGLHLQMGGVGEGVGNRRSGRLQMGKTLLKIGTRKEAFKKMSGQKLRFKKGLGTVHILHVMKKYLITGGGGKRETGEGEGPFGSDSSEKEKRSAEFYEAGGQGKS